MREASDGTLQRVLLCHDNLEVITMNSSMRRIAVAAALCVSPALQAETVNVTISGNLPTTSINNYYAWAGSQIGFQWVAEADAFVNALQRSSFSLDFSYDIDTVRSGSPLAFREGVTLTGGSIGGVTDFSAWDPTITLTASGSTSRILFEGWKKVFDFPDPLRPGRDQYIYFSINATFASASSLASNAELPQGPFNLSDFSNITGEVGYRGGDSGGQEYAYWVIRDFSALSVAPAAGVVPEPASWAMLIAGLIGVAGFARRHHA